MLRMLEATPPAQPDHSADVSKMVNGDVVSRREAIDAINHIFPVDTEYDCTLLDRVDVICVLSDLTPAQPDNRLSKIAELVEGTIEHFDLDDAMDLLYQIKEIVGNETSNIRG